MIVSDWVHVIIPLLKPVECTTPRVNPEINYGLQGIKMCQCRFIHGNIGTALAEAVDNREAMHV